MRPSTKSARQLGRAIVYAVLAIVIVLLLLFVWSFNRVERINDANEMMRILRQQQPNVLAFAVSFDRNSQQATNVLLDQRGRALVKDTDKLPIRTSGAYFRLDPHGKVTYDDTGYTVTGIVSNKFVCPNGFGGKDCALLPLCTPSDVGKLKPLTYSQFNALRLYEASALGDDISSTRRKRQTGGQELLYPRIRVRCLNQFGAYRLESCPRNELLNENLECKPYDICTDSVDGYRHKLQIHPDQKLRPNQYYVCRDDRSVLAECADKDSVWVDRDKLCEISNVCTNLDDDTTLPADNNQNAYVTCQGGQPKLVQCEYGVEILSNGRRVCRRQTCVPSVERYEDTHLRYATSAVRCNGEEPSQLNCTEQSSAKTFPFAWKSDKKDVQFNIVVPNWPDRVYDEQKLQCVTPDQSKVLYNPVVTIRYTDIMPRPYSFDITARKFVCQPNQSYWDYAGTGNLLPNQPKGRYGVDYFLETAQPCHDNVSDASKAPWYPVSSIATTGSPPFLVQTYTDYVIKDKSLWPTFDDGNGNLVTDFTLWPYVLLPRDSNDKFLKPTPDQIAVYAPRIDFRPSQRCVAVTVTLATGVGPPGFKYAANDAEEPHSDAPLQLTGFGTPNYNDRRDQLYFTIGSGKFDQPIMPPNSTKLYEERYPWPPSPTITSFADQETIVYGVVWPLVTNDEVNLFANVYFSRSKGFYSRTTNVDGSTSTTMLDVPLYCRLRLTRQNPDADPDYPTLLGDALADIVGFNVLVAYGRGSVLVTGQRLPLQLNIP